MVDPIEQARQITRDGKSRFLNTFVHVPDDKLTWTPSPTAKSALRIAAHAGVSNQALLGVLSGQPFPPVSMEELAAMGDAAEEAITTREQAVALIEGTTESVVAALGRISPEQIGTTVETPFMTAPLGFFMNLFGAHMSQHAAQIDYLQAIWGDQEFHF